MLLLYLRRRLLAQALAVFLCLAGNTLEAKIKTSKDTIAIVYDSSVVTERKIPEADKKKLLENKEYLYDRIGPAPKGLWERFWDWFWHKVDGVFETKGGEIGWKIFEYSLAIAVIVLVILLLVKNDVRFLFYGKSAAVPIDFREFDEDINKINFDELIEQAIANKDFRKAVRLHFLKLLKQLTEVNLIQWKIDKTNNDYSIELAQSAYNKQFRELSFLYEHIWYGDFELDEQGYTHTLNKFKQLHIAQ